MSLIKIDPSTTVSFTGYRPEKIQRSDPNNEFLFAEIQARLFGTVHILADKGYITYLSGMAAGFDIMAANAVLLARNTYPEIKLVCVIPFPEQASGFTPYWKAEHGNILKQANQIVTLFGRYHTGVFHQRNDYLVNNCSTLVCYYDGQAGGTQYTVELAQRNGCEVLNLFRSVEIQR